MGGINCGGFLYSGKIKAFSQSVAAQGQVGVAVRRARDGRIPALLVFLSNEEGGVLDLARGSRQAGVGGRQEGKFGQYTPVKRLGEE